MKYNKIILLFTLLAVMVGCSDDDFLERPDMDIITTDNFWKSSKDLELYVNQFYTAFPQLNANSYSAGIYWSDDNSDNMIREVANVRLAGNNTEVTGGGSWSFSRIKNVNIFLENYQTVEDDFESYKHFVGEALFFRAYFNFNLLQAYGDYPYVDKVLAPDSEELYAARTPRNVCAQNMIADLDEAIGYMVSGQNSNGNRLNKEIAQLLKARIALYEGTWEKHHAGTDFGVAGSDGSDFLNIAASAASDLMGSGKYSVHNTGKLGVDYFNLFGQTDLTGHSEVMLWKKFDVDLGLAHNAQRYLSASGGGRGLTKLLIDDYLCTDGLPTALSSEYQGDDSLAVISVNRDPRLAQTIWIPGQVYEVKDGEVTKYFEKSSLNDTGEEICPTGYQIRKGSNPDWYQKNTSKKGTTTSPIFRYAEALLIYAEAKAELGTITQTDINNTINKLRARVAMPTLELNTIADDPNWLFPTLSPIINEVRRERHVEFAAEGYRAADVMRWAAHDELTNGKRRKGAKFVQSEFPELVVGVDILLDENGYIDVHQGELPAGYQFNLGRDYLLPVPPTQITLNPNLTQNPGW